MLEYILKNARVWLEHLLSKEIASRFLSTTLWPFIHMFFAMICIASKSYLLALFLATPSIILVYIYTARLFRYIEVYCRGLIPGFELAKLSSINRVIAFTLISFLVPFMYVVNYVTRYAIKGSAIIVPIEIFLTVMVACILLHIFLAIAFHKLSRATEMRIFAIVRNAILEAAAIPIAITVAYTVYVSYVRYIDVWRSLLIAVTVVLFTELLTKLMIDGRADKLFEKVISGGQR